MAHKDFTLLRINEIPFKMNLDVADLNDDRKKRIGISFLFIFQYQEDNEASAMHAVVHISLDESIILEGGATFIFKSKTWDEMPHDEECVKKIRIHDLRHSHVAYLIELGFSPVEIAERMGHESISVTFTYSHLYPSKQKSLADKLNADRELAIQKMCRSEENE